MKRDCTGQAVFGWVSCAPQKLRELENVRESEVRTSDPMFDSQAVRTRAQCAAILSAREHRTVTESMVRTLEDKAFEKLIIALATVNPIFADVLLAQTDEEIAAASQLLSDIAREP